MRKPQNKCFLLFLGTLFAYNVHKSHEHSILVEPQWTGVWWDSKQVPGEQVVAMTEWIGPPAAQRSHICHWNASCATCFEGDAIPRNNSKESYHILYYSCYFPVSQPHAWRRMTERKGTFGQLTVPFLLSLLYSLATQDSVFFIKKLSKIIGTSFVQFLHCSGKNETCVHRSYKIWIV